MFRSITLVALIGNPTLLHMGTATHLALSLSLGTLAVLVVILLVAGNTRLGARLAGHANWLGFLGAVHLGIDRMRRHPGEAASVLVTAFAYQLTIVFAALDCGPRPRAQHGLVAMAFVPIVAIAQVLPVVGQRPRPPRGAPWCCCWPPSGCPRARPSPSGC